MAELEELVKIEITKPLPETGVIGVTYKIEGSVKIFDAIGAPPWVYAEVRRKEWWKPEFIEEVSYERGFPMPVTGTFSIDIRPEEKSDYEVTIIATPAPLSLPVVGVFPIVGKSDMVKIRVAEPTATDIKNIEISVIGLAYPATDLKGVVISVIGPAYPATDLKGIEIDVIGPEFPATDLKNIEIDVIGPAYPTTDLKSIEISVVPIAPPEYTLDVTIEPSGAGHVLISPKAPYSAGEVVTLVATPYPGYEFDHWGGWPPYPGVGSTSSTLKLTMTSNWWVVAVFREVAPPPAEYTLEVAIEPPGTGDVTISPSKAMYSAGEVVTLTAHPRSGYEFDHWGGWPPYPGIQSTSPTLELTMTADWWVVAAFREAVPVVTTVTMAIKNPPYRGNYWQLRLFKEVWGSSVRVGQHIPVGQPITLQSLPAGWTFPLYIDIMIYEFNVSPYNVVLKVQSAYGPDWGDYNKDLIIPDYGSYYYDVATGKFEKV